MLNFAKVLNLSHLESFSGIEIGRKIKIFIVSFHNFGKGNPTFIILKIISIRIKYPQQKSLFNYTILCI